MSDFSVETAPARVSRLPQIRGRAGPTGNVELLGEPATLPPAGS